jgi:ubiquitin thioesterase protein OTUB1
MSRPTVMGGFHGHGQAHAGQHYGVPAQSHYNSIHSGLSFARPLPMRAPVLAPAGFNHHQLQHTGHHQHGRSQNHNQNQQHHLSTMADPYMASDEQMAHLQKLSSEYEPEATVSLLCLGGMTTAADRHQGPLVGERQSSAAITTEYANADPIYRVKTAALPGKYAYFRTCRGDGHCGWRGESSAPS